jgi:hypothetical protein
VGDGLLGDQADGPRSTMRVLAIRPLARGVDPVFAMPTAASNDDDEAAAVAP